MNCNFIIKIPTIAGIIEFKTLTLEAFETITGMEETDVEKAIGLAENGVEYDFCVPEKKLEQFCTNVELFNKLPQFEKKAAVGRYMKKLCEIVETYWDSLKIPQSQLMMGEVNDEENPKCNFQSQSLDKKIVYDYCGRSFSEQEKMNYLEWRKMCADACKYNLSRSAEGVIILNSARNEMDPRDDRAHLWA